MFGGGGGGGGLLRVIELVGIILSLQLLLVSEDSRKNQPPDLEEIRAVSKHQLKEGSSLAAEVIGEVKVFLGHPVHPQNDILEFPPQKLLNISLRTILQGGEGGINS